MQRASSCRGGCPPDQQHLPRQGQVGDRGPNAGGGQRADVDLPHQRPAGGVQRGDVAAGGGVDEGALGRHRGAQGGEGGSD